MINFITKFFGMTPNDNAIKTGSFSAFFTKTGSAEKKKVIRQVVKKANEDQKELVKRYDRKFSRV